MPVTPLDYRSIHEKAGERGQWEVVPFQDGIGVEGRITVDLSAQILSRRNNLLIPPFVNPTMFFGPWWNGVGSTWGGTGTLDDSGGVALVWPHLYFNRPLVPGKDRVLIQYVE